MNRMNRRAGFTAVEVGVGLAALLALSILLIPAIIAAYRAAHIGGRTLQQIRASMEEMRRTQEELNQMLAEKEKQLREAKEDLQRAVEASEKRAQELLRDKKDMEHKLREISSDLRKEERAIKYLMERGSPEEPDASK